METLDPMSKVKCYALLLGEELVVANIIGKLLDFTAVQ